MSYRIRLVSVTTPLVDVVYYEPAGSFFFSLQNEINKSKWIFVNISMVVLVLVVMVS